MTDSNDDPTHADELQEIRKEWLKMQKQQAKDWKDIYEKRSKYDIDMIDDWWKSWMATSLKIGASNSKTMKHSRKIHIEQMEHFIKHLDSLLDD